MARRKHIMTFTALATIHRDNADRLHEAIANRPNDTLAVEERDGEPDPAGWVTYLVKYGPVRGANKHDVVRFFERLGCSYALSTRTETEYECGCEYLPGSCEVDFATR